MAIVNVEKFELTYEGEPVEIVGNLMFLKTHIDYAGGMNGIMPGDTISIKIDNAASEILRIVGMGNNTVDIYGDEPIGKVGTRTFRNEGGDFYLDVLFDSGYDDFYGGEQPSNIKGWLETSVYVEYKKQIPEPGTREDITIYINGVKVTITVDVKPGGGGEPQILDNPGFIVGKSWRYGNHSGNLGDLPEVPDNDYINFEPLRWNVMMGTQNLTWRDLRATNGDHYFTTQNSLDYSNSTPTAPRYNSENEPYLAPYAIYFGLHIDAPFHYNKVMLEDYLAVGMFNGSYCSAHEYVQNSLRIIRVVGREENNEWWGKDAFRYLVDSNFLVHQPGEPIDRYLTDLFFKDKRGLTISEFLAQMHSEGQLLDKATPDDILKFDYVYNSESPFTDDPDDKTLIPHFTLQLGDLHFDETETTLDLIGSDNSVIFDNVPAKNLPYGYWIYYDTTAIEAVMDKGYFYYFNAVRFKHEDGETDAGSTDLWVKLEDGSGGSGHITEVRIKKIDEDGNPVQGVKFTLIHTNVVPQKIRTAVTTINGTASFTVVAGEYTLIEEVPVGSTLIPLAEMHFTITNTDNPVNLKELLENSGYPDIERIEFFNNLNVLTNHSGSKSVDVVINGTKSAIGRQLECGQFEFVLLDKSGKEVARTKNGEE